MSSPVIGHGRGLVICSMHAMPMTSVVVCLQALARVKLYIVVEAGQASKKGSCRSALCLTCESQASPITAPHIRASAPHGTDTNSPPSWPRSPSSGISSNTPHARRCTRVSAATHYQPDRRDPRHCRRNPPERGTRKHYTQRRRTARAKVQHAMERSSMAASGRSQGAGHAGRGGQGEFCTAGRG